jgi:DNA-directed RNA polymerase specialized sigma24 family protein
VTKNPQCVARRFFGGLSVEETAEVLAVSPETVMRDWKFARSWLQAKLSNGQIACSKKTYNSCQFSSSDCA